MLYAFWGGNHKLILHAASGDVNEVSRLLAKSHVDKNFQDKYGWTALIYASMGGYVEVVRALVQTKADVNLQDKDGWTALAWAVKKGHVDILEILLQARADVNLQDEEGKTALVKSVEVGNVEIVKALVRANANVDIQNKDGVTALMFAACKGFLDVVKVLIRAKADVDLQEKLGWTALMHAAKNGHAEVAEVLVQAKANVNVQNNSGATALMFAANGDGHAKVVEVLLQAKADVNLQDEQGLKASGVTKQLHILLLLRKREAEMNAAPSLVPGMEMLGTAYQGGLAAVTALWSGSVAEKSVPNKRTQRNLDLLAAAESGDLTTVTDLLAGYNVDKDYVDEYGMTALMYAALHDRVEVVCALIRAGANATIETKFGKTARDLTRNSDIKNRLAFYEGHSPSAAASAATRQPSPPPDASTAPVTAANDSKGDDTVQFSASPAAALMPTPATAPTSINTSPLRASSEQASVSAEFTEQDRTALQTLSQATTQSLLLHGRLNEVMLTVAAHDRTLQLLVSKQKECPSLFWFYPKKRELRNWLSNPSKCLFQDTLMMVVVCPVTLCVVQCGPEGVGWEVSMPKRWVQKWGPAIIMSIYVMQAAVLAGRIVGIPLPHLPSAANLTGLSACELGGVSNEAVIMQCLTEFASTTATVLDQHSPEISLMLSRIQEQGKSSVQLQKFEPLVKEKVKQMTEDAYKSMHTFLTTGDNAKLGKLEDQLRGRMERVMAPNGDVDWVSVEGREIWLEQRKQLPLQPAEPSPAQTLHPTGVYAKPATQASTAVKPSTSSIFSWTRRTCAVSPTSRAGSNSWLFARLEARGVSAEHVRLCEAKLVVEEGLSSEDLLAALPVDSFQAAYLNRLGINAMGLQMQLIAMHGELRAQYHPPSPNTRATPVHDESAATFTAEHQAIMSTMQSTIESLESKLSKLSSSPEISSAAGAPKANSYKGAGSGGRMQVQVQAVDGAVNPTTGQPYWVDHMNEKIVRLERELALAHRNIGDVAAATEERLDGIAVLSPNHHRIDSKISKRTTSYLPLCAVVVVLIAVALAFWLRSM